VQISPGGGGGAGEHPMHPHKIHLDDSQVRDEVGAND
jgi:hypothetical protein